MPTLAIAGASAALRLAVVELGKVVIKECPRLFRVTEDLEWIDNEMRYIQAYLQDIEDKQWESRGLTNLVRNIWDIAYDVEDIVNTYFPKLEPRGRNGRNGLLGCLTSAKWLCTNLKTARGFAVEIEDIKKRVGDIDRARRTYEIKDKSGDDKGDTSDPRRSFPHTDDVNVVGRDIKSLAAEVINDDIKRCVVFPIVGVSGVGKTTLARSVYKIAQRQEGRIFNCSAWIYVSRQPNISKLLLALAKDVELGEDELQQNLEVNLSNHLKKKRYLIVIDDIWQTETWDALLVGIPTNSNNGSRIILTSQINHVGEYAGGPDPPRVLKRLSPDDSRQLFGSVVGEHPSELDLVRDGILDKCGGMPLAIKLIACTLSRTKRTKDAWQGVLDSMGQMNQYLAIPELSYKDLPTKLKPCFLYFGLFPANHEIPASEMINLWVAEGFIQRGPGMREVEEVGDDYLNQFASRNMILVERIGELDGRILRCSIPDVIRSFCVKVARDINFFNTHIDVANTRNLSTTKVRRITADLHIPLYYTTPKLRAMLCFHKENHSEFSEKGLKKFLADLNFLRILSLDFKILEMSLPSDIGNLRYLTYIRLRVKYAKLPSAISNLRNLLTLDARGCDHLVMPNCIWNLKQLTHLLLSPSCKIEFCSGGLLQLLHPIEDSPSNLETLYSFRVSRRRCSKYQFPKLFTNLRKLGVSFTDGGLSNVKVLIDAARTVSYKLEKLRLESFYQTLNDPYNIVDLNLPRYENLSRLYLGGRIVTLPECDILFPKLTKLTLVKTKLKKDPMETLKELSKLKILKLGEESYLQQTMSANSNSFPQLEVLEIDKLNHVKEIEVMQGAMPQLRKIRITGIAIKPRVNIANRNPDDIVKFG